MTNKRRVSLWFSQSRCWCKNFDAGSLFKNSAKHMVGSGETGDMIDKKAKKACTNWNYNS